MLAPAASAELEFAQVRGCDPQDTWGSLAEALDSNKPDLFKLPNANLDTGLADASGQPVFVV